MPPIVAHARQRWVIRAAGPHPGRQSEAPTSPLVWVANCLSTNSASLLMLVQPGGMAGPAVPIADRSGASTRTTRSTRVVSGRMETRPGHVRRHARACPAHPDSSSAALPRNRDGRDKPGHDDETWIDPAGIRSGATSHEAHQEHWLARADRSPRVSRSRLGMRGAARPPNPSRMDQRTPPVFTIGPL